MSVIPKNDGIFIASVYVTEIFDTDNPFKDASIVAEPYFTDRRDEFRTISSFLNSPNHLILISPRRFGKTGLMKKVLEHSDRAHVFINVQKAVGVADLARLFVKETLKQFPLDSIKTHLKISGSCRQFR